MSSIASISSSTGANSAADATPKIPTQTLGQEDFLKLLVTQMTSQDPLNPQSDTDFVAQMAQFSALEQNKTVAAGMTKLNSQQAFSQAAALLGRTVQVQTGSGTTDQGVVTALQMNSGTALLQVNGQLYDLSQVLSVTPTPANQ